MWQRKFLPRWAGRKKVSAMIQRKLKELGGNLWEFSSDVLNFPREVGGEVIVESEGAGEEIDLEENEGKEEGCGGEFHDRKYSVGDEEGCSGHWAQLLRSPFSVYSAPIPFGSVADKDQKGLYTLRDLLKEEEIVKGKYPLNCF